LLTISAQCLNRGNLTLHGGCLSGMQLSDAPCWGAFTFEWLNRTIYIPQHLNNVARYKPDRFWNWLLEQNPYDYYIHLTYQHIVDEEQH